jgi:hypothetical protein
MGCIRSMGKGMAKSRWNTVVSAGTAPALTINRPSCGARSNPQYVTVNARSPETGTGHPDLHDPATIPASTAATEARNTGPATDVVVFTRGRAVVVVEGARVVGAVIDDVTVVVVVVTALRGGAA